MGHRDQAGVPIHPTLDHDPPDCLGISACQRRYKHGFFSQPLPLQLGTQSSDQIVHPAPDQHKGNVDVHAGSPRTRCRIRLHHDLEIIRLVCSHPQQDEPAHRVFQLCPAPRRRSHDRHGRHHRRTPVPRYSALDLSAFRPKHIHQHLQRHPEPARPECHPKPPPGGKPGERQRAVDVAAGLQKLSQHVVLPRVNKLGPPHPTPEISALDQQPEQEPRRVIKGEHVDQQSLHRGAHHDNSRVHHACNRHRAPRGQDVRARKTRGRRKQDPDVCRRGNDQRVLEPHPRHHFKRKRPHGLAPRHHHHLGRVPHRNHPFLHPALVPQHALRGRKPSATPSRSRIVPGHPDARLGDAPPGFRPDQPRVRHAEDWASKQAEDTGVFRQRMKARLWIRCRCRGRTLHL